MSKGDSKTQPVIIKLANNLDQLLYDRNYKNVNGGLFLPAEGDPGTGNIVIKGSPGTGKSTLALQMLYQTVCGKENKQGPVEGYFALYFTLEEQIDHIINKMKAFRWENEEKECQLRKLVHLENTDETTSPDKLADYMIKILTQPCNCIIRNLPGDNEESLSEDPENKICKVHLSEQGKIIEKTGSRVLLPMLSPKSISTSDFKSTYWERYKQIEKYLIAADYVKKQKKRNPEKFINVPELKMICIDSLNVFGDKQLDRDEIFRLFDLFKRYSIIGIFIFESNQDYSNRYFSQMNDDIDFSADVVISLQNDQDKGYMMRYFEVAKSRYKPQVFGKHPYFIVNHKDTDVGSGKEAYLPFWVYPSLHYKQNEFVNEGELSADNMAGRGLKVKKGLNQASSGSTMDSLFNEWKQRFGNIIPSSFKRNCVIMINGHRNTFKSTIARDFLLQGLKQQEKNEVKSEVKSGGKPGGEKEEIINGLFISLEDKHYGNPSDWWQYKNEKSEQFIEESVIHDPGLGRHILDIRKWNCGEKDKKRFIISVVIRKKAITAEEFIHHLQFNILNKYKNIRRVVLDEVNMIGVSYPFLESSKTSGELFLNAFVSLLKKMDIDLIFTGTIGEIPQGDDVINRAVSLSDLVISTKFLDIFGKQNVIFTGGGLIANQKNTASDKLIPGVLRMEEYITGKKRFTIDNEHLKGLVGFEQGKVYRPGLTINLFQEGDLQKEYNKQITIMYNLSFPERTNKERQNEHDKKIYISTFNDLDVEAMRETVKRIRDNTPLEGTVVSMVDEYWGSPELCRMENGDVKSECSCSDTCEMKVINCPKELRRLYYTNCLVLAYRKDIIGDRFNEIKEISWEKIYELAKDARKEKKENTDVCLLDSDFFITETLSCLLLDSIVTAYEQDVQKVTSQNSASAEIVMDNPLLQDAFEHFHKGSINKTLLKQLYYLNLLFNDMDKQYVTDKYHSTEKWNKMCDHSTEKCNKMYDNSIMYICWYTQLRDFLRDNPQHISKLAVMGLPGGGFSGDWMIEVMPGSLSNVLGTDTLDLMCKPEEEIKRFIQGVGLPAWLNSNEYKKYNMNNSRNLNLIDADYIGKLPAWIGAENTTLNDMSGFYKNANRRKEIADYEKYRYMLSIAFRRIMTIKYPKEYNKFEEVATNILEELKSYIKQQSVSPPALIAEQNQ